MKNNLNGVAPLAYLGVIRVTGEDAAQFLHGQLTQDFLLLGRSEARLAAFCSAKGRMQASFIGFKRSPDEILLVCSRDILAPTLKRLSMFVLRAKAKLNDASGDYALYGLAGSAVDAAIESAATHMHTAWAKSDLGHASVISLYPADGVRRALWVAPLAETRPAGDLLGEPDWLWGEVRSGIAHISAPIVEAFVPQMLNYESVGGVSFKKGCYPGQEVVARSQFRGTLKRRAYLAHSAQAIHAGDELFASDDPDQPCGVVAQSAVAPAGGVDAIVSMQISAFEAGGVHALGPDGPLLVLSPPPYPLLADI